MKKSIIGVVALMVSSFVGLWSSEGAVIRKGDYEASVTEEGLVVKYKGIKFISGSLLSVYKPEWKGIFYSQTNLLATKTARLNITASQITITDSIPAIEGEFLYQLEVDEKGVTVSLRLRINKEIQPGPGEFAVAMFPPEQFAGGKYKILTLFGEHEEWQTLPIEKPKVTGPGTFLMAGDLAGLKLKGKELEISIESRFGPRPHLYDMRSRHDLTEAARIYWLLYSWQYAHGEMIISTRFRVETVAIELEGMLKEERVFMVEDGRRLEMKAIFVDKNAHKVEKAAAKELQRYIARICLQELPIIETDKKLLSKTGVFYVGRSETAKKQKLFSEHEFKLLGSDDSFIARAKDGNILLAGKGYRGTVYAVYWILEKLGCRFYADELEIIPTKRTIEILSPFSISEAPAFEWRAMSGTILPVKCRLSPGDRKAEVGGVELPRMMAMPKYKGQVWSWHHTMPLLLPTDEYFEKHPEYFALIRGKRFVDPWKYNQQHCLSNPDVLRLMTEAVLRWIKEDPEPIYYPVHYGDVRHFCECDECKMLYAEKGSITDAVIWFVNQIAEEVRKKYSGKFVTNLAYLTTRQPPVREKPLPNHLIIFCSILECQARPWSAPVNLKLNVMKDLEGWIAMHPLGAKGIISFDYPCTYHYVGFPYPILYAYVENLRYYKRLGLRGVYVCGLTGAPGARCAHLVHLYSYVIPRIMWNPEQDLGKIIDEFTQAWYGSAWKPMREYIELLHQSAIQSTSEGVMDCHGGPRQKFFRDLFTPEFLDKAYKLFETAEKIAKMVEPEFVRRRIQNEKWGLLFADLFLQEVGDIIPDDSERGFQDRPFTIERYHKIGELLRITHLLGQPWDTNWGFVRPGEWGPVDSLSSIVGFEPTTSPWWMCPKIKEIMGNSAKALKTG